jgi:hypothetical protein
MRWNLGSKTECVRTSAETKCLLKKFDTKLEFRETERNRSRSTYDQPPAASRLPPRKARPVLDLEEVKSRFIFEEKAVFVEGATFKRKTCLCLSFKV